MIGDFSCAADSLGPWDVNYKGLLADEPMCCVFRPGAKANIVISLDIKTETEEGNAGGCWALFAKAFSYVNLTVLGDGKIWCGSLGQSSSASLMLIVFDSLIS